MPMTVVDAHLDLSYNALRGRDVGRPAREQPANEDGIASVGLPDLHAGHVALVCATIFCEPATTTQPGYHDAEQAHAAALRHLEWYRQMNAKEKLHTTLRRSDVPGADNTHDGPLPAVLLLEGADPLRTPEDAELFFSAGVRIVGLAWRRTRYAGGTGAPGPLTQAGVAVVKAFDRLGMIHDLSHLAEEAFWQLLDQSGGPVIASHSNCRAIVPTDRQLSDEMIHIVASRGGVIGINFFDKFLIPPGEYPNRRATLADVARHVRHMCELTGSAEHVGLGTDMDGGLGREQIPVEIETSADLPRVGEALSADGFSDADVAKFLGGNWLRFFRGALPD